jgi:two-component system chemotaxis response regulator CheY
MHNLKFLVLDDSMTVTMLVHKLLNELGATQVFRAVKVEEALKILQSEARKNEPVHVAICDHHMENLSGIHFLNAIRCDSDLQRMAFIAMSTDKSEETVRKHAENGTDAFLVKPVTKESLEAKILMACAKRRIKVVIPKS